MTSAFDVKTDSAGGIFVADTEANRVRRIAPDGTITLIAGNGSFTSSGDGGLATNAGIRPTALALAQNGDLYVAEAGTIRRVTPDGHIFAFAGGTPTSNADGVPASQARFSSIRALAFDSTGNLFVADDRSVKKSSRPVSSTPWPFSSPIQSHPLPPFIPRALLLVRRETCSFPSRMIGLPRQV